MSCNYRRWLIPVLVLALLLVEHGDLPASGPDEPLGAPGASPFPTEGGSPGASPGDSRPASKIHPTLLRRLAEVKNAKPVKAWVLFKDKGFASPQARRGAIVELSSTYNPRAIERRRKRRTLPGLFDEHDLPVSQRYIEAVAGMGVEVHVSSKWVNGVSVWGTREQFDRIAELEFVRIIQPVRRGRKIYPPRVIREPQDRASLVGSGGPAGGSFYGESAEQLAQINLIALHDLGFTAAGVIVGILDTGFQRSHAAFNAPTHPINVIAEYDFINDDPDASIEPGDPFSQHAHGTWILGTLGAYMPGELVGAAYDASFILCKTEDITDEYPAEEDNYVAGLELIEANGGDMATSSLGYIDWYTQDDLDGLTAVTTVAVNIATANGVHCCTAAGNGGHDSDSSTSHLLAPADAFEVLACGAVTSAGTIASFSSDGPTADGRVKPEVLARGVNTRTVDAFADTGYVGVSGTSLSTPLVAGAVACLIQAHPEWTVDRMRSHLFYTASDYAIDGTFDPTYVRGYGVIDALAASTLPEHACCYTDGSCATLPRDDCLLTSGLPRGPGSTCLGDNDGNGIDDVCEQCFPIIAPAQPSSGSHALNEKNRFLSFVPDNPGEITALRVTLTASADFPGLVGASWWVGPPQEVCENPGQGADLPPELCGPAPGIPKNTLLSARLQCTQHCMDWGAIGDVVHVADRNIVPNADYEIQAILCECDVNEPANYSLALPISTSLWGDLVEDCTTTPCGPPDGVVDLVTDVVSVLDKFQNLPGAAIKARVDLEPDVPDFLINITDVLRGIGAFEGNSYPFAGPEPCP